MIHLCVSVVLFGESPHALAVLNALQQQELDEGTNVSLVVVDNGAPETVRAEILEQFGGKILLLRNRENLGFSAGVNQCVAEALNYEADYLLLLNPDLRLDVFAVREMLRTAEKDAAIAMITPKLLRAAENLEPVTPAVFDACGMMITRSLRHLDRGAGEAASNCYEIEEDVFGGSGACLMLRVKVIHELFLSRTEKEKALYKIYPQLESGAETRPQLFDEAFFAYREDADLAFRAQIRGLRISYCPAAVGYHVRRVTPERRGKLSAEINSLSVRNRFLLQLNNYRPLFLPATIIPGFVARNLLVLFAVFLKERSSLGALKQVIQLSARALEHRRAIFAGCTSKQYKELGRYFR